MTRDTDGSQRLRRCDRIGKRREFLSIYQRGRKIRSRNFVLYAMPSGLPFHRLGVTVSKKVGKAVVRNRVKRRLREIFRRNRPGGVPPVDLVINAKKSIAELEFDQLHDELIEGLRRLGKILREA